MRKWVQTASRVVHQDRWILLRADKCVLPNGKTLEPYFVLEEKDWVHVIALDSQNRILTTRQYRHAAGTICLEIPCGVINPGEAHRDAAKRELEEETGYIANDWISVMTPFANPARQSNRIHCFIARNLSETGSRNLDESEEIEFQWMPEAELKKNIFEGEFSQALHIASVLAAWEFLKHQPG